MTPTHFYVTLRDYIKKYICWMLLTQGLSHCCYMVIAIDCVNNKEPKLEEPTPVNIIALAYLPLKLPRILNYVFGIILAVHSWSFSRKDRREHVWYNIYAARLEKKFFRRKNLHKSIWPTSTSITTKKVMKKCELPCLVDPICQR